MRFPRQEYWSELPFSPPGDIPDQTCVFCIGRQILYHRAAWEAHSIIWIWTMYIHCTHHYRIRENIYTAPKFLVLHNYALHPTLLIPATTDLFTVSRVLSFSECQLEFLRILFLKLPIFSLCSLCLSFPKHTKVCQFYGSFDCSFILSGLLTLLFYFNSIFGKHTN